MSCCPLLAWRSTSRSWAESRWAWYSAGASPRCTWYSYRAVGKSRPGFPGDWCAEGTPSSARPPSARDPTHERRVAGGHRRQSRRSPPALPLDQRDGPSASRTRTQAGKHWGIPSCAPPRSGSPSGLRGSGSASALERARTRFNYYGPLLRIGPLQDAGELLQACSAGWFAPALGAAKLDTARGHGGRLLVVILTGCRYPFQPPPRARLPGAALPLRSGRGFVGQRRS
jgi:hypothetical protein